MKMVAAAAVVEGFGVGWVVMAAAVEALIMMTMMIGHR
jgi:hypothetical protein